MLEMLWRYEQRYAARAWSTPEMMWNFQTDWFEPELIRMHIDDAAGPESLPPRLGVHGATGCPWQTGAASADPLPAILKHSDVSKAQPPSWGGHRSLESFRR